MTENYVNPYFAHNNPSNENEQDLIHGFYAEAVQQMGYKMAYIQRDLNDGNIDDFFGENNLSVFNDYFYIELYVASIEQFEGDGDIMSMFGVSVKDRVTLQMSQRRFRHLSGFDHGPREGDLIYFPFNGNLFEIKFSEDEEQFYPLATLPAYTIRCELFDYSSERFETGHPDIDSFALDSNDLEHLEMLGGDIQYDDTDDAEEEGESFIDPDRNESVWGDFGKS